MTTSQRTRLETLIERKQRYKDFPVRFWKGFAISVGIGLFLSVTLFCLAVKSLELLIRNL